MTQGKLEQTIDNAIGDSADEMHISQISVVRREILSAIQSAGFVVVDLNSLTKETIDEMENFYDAMDSGQVVGRNEFWGYRDAIVKASAIEASPLQKEASPNPTLEEK